jgi:hypothetical protein
VLLFSSAFSPLEAQSFSSILVHLTDSVLTIFFVGPGSPGWITITEQGIRQSFDLTRVMFCRGNISEKIRFGKLVQRGEIVLDLYSGIGYFTVPALVHGEAEYLYAIGWNPKRSGFVVQPQDNYYCVQNAT